MSYKESILSIPRRNPVLLPPTEELKGPSRPEIQRTP